MEKKSYINILENPICSGFDCPRYGYGNTEDPQNNTCFKKGGPCVHEMQNIILYQQKSITKLKLILNDKYEEIIELCNENTLLIEINERLDCELHTLEANALKKIDDLTKQLMQSEITKVVVIDSEYEEFLIETEEEL
jgi:hypothetical protein